MREEGTEMPGSSDLNDEQRKGFIIVSVVIKNSFSFKVKESNLIAFLFQSFENVFETKTDHLQGYPRTEYHCIKCGGHHGHIFDDGPKPTGKRYCNNGKVLTFKEEK